MFYPAKLLLFRRKKSVLTIFNKIMTRKRFHFAAAAAHQNCTKTENRANADRKQVPRCRRGKSNWFAK